MKPSHLFNTLFFLLIGGTMSIAESNTGAPTEGPKNRLASEKSPYLLQHAENPVNWYPWGTEAFTAAREQDKPIFLSIGYATCHWCHVMEHESFEDPEVAELLNRVFVSIKVDREERPDIDQVYMTVCQMLTGSGGWPLTIVMTPDRKPFFAATYIPKHTRYGRMGMMDLIPRIEQAWSTERDQLLSSSEKIVDHLRSTSGQASQGTLEIGVVGRAVQQLGSRFDATHGGFGDAPKFPSPHNHLLLIEHWRRTGAERSLEMVELTLEAMRRGGVYDHIGYGFHRYSTDRGWLVPHFEKMLYDQAMLSLAYTETFSATGKPVYERIVREVMTYVRRDMTSSEGAFFSAEDADSEGVEGKFYVWSLAEVQKILGKDDAALAARVWNLTAEGNFEDEATGRKTGANIPYRSQPLADLAGKSTPGEFDRRLETTRRRLFESRECRIHPLKDDKILADWNGLMAAAMARASVVLSEPEYRTAAEKAVDFVMKQMRDDAGRLFHRFRDGEVAIQAFLDDYAFLTWALIELYDASLEPVHLENAIQLQDAAVDLFWDDARGGFFFTADGAEDLLVRQKEVYDGAMPSGNSVAMANLVRLSRLTGRADLAKRADQLATAFAPEVSRMPSAHTHLLTALQAAASPSLEIVVAGTSGSNDTSRLLRTVRGVSVPGAALLFVPSGSDGDPIRKLAPFAAGYGPVEGHAAAYVCRDFTCRLPTTDPKELSRLLRQPAESSAASPE